ncbi:hypothetical protein DESC_190070 [Desulfosarcina cetonica]|uniref:hypothetical protein n=1 Tax=Desulfosarcina cetonica TaxID=90730 RepID=UPI0006D2CA64|nr:hypothetical protein [Desulfosarcina cetonica]VTR64453.1 hypothetical protein DESC_190070 [Desulfosarcina cetonica]
MSAKSDYVDQMIEEILTDITLKNPTPKANDLNAAQMDGIFNSLFEDEDATSKAVMHKIWSELQTMHLK